MKLMFYCGPGDLITRLIRLLTKGPFSHVELQFSNGWRFFSSGHGLYLGVHMHRDHKVYDEWWKPVTIPVSQEEEDAALRFAFQYIGLPFDWRGMFGFLLPFMDSRRKAKYCSSIILDVLQSSLHMFKEHKLKVSPNGLYRLLSTKAPNELSSVTAAKVESKNPVPLWFQQAGEEVNAGR
jgi:hypothetical protein